MKFVLFNIAVAAALIFLFNADRTDLRALADRAYAAVGQAKDMAEETTQKAEAPVVETVATAPAAPPAPKAEPPKPAAPKLDPAVAQRRAEVLDVEAKPQPASVAEISDQLMTPEQRRRELFTLAEEMELFYVRRLNR